MNTAQRQSNSDNFSVPIESLPIPLRLPSNHSNQALTKQRLCGNFEVLCRRLHKLFIGKALD